jgi:hypothetical protein
MASGGLEGSTDKAPSGRFRAGLWADASVGAALALALGVIYVVDAHTFSSAPAPLSHADLAERAPEPPEPPAPLEERTAFDPTPRVELHTTADGRFGLLCLSGNPDDSTDDGKRLTFSPEGKTNNTRVMVDGRAPIFGGSQGETIESWHAGPLESTVMDWSYRDVRVRQSLRLVAGDVSRRVDTVRVSYELTNNGSKTRQVGLRVMLDTLIGDNDGVPFIVPGREGIVTRTLDMSGGEVPDFVRSLERPSLSSPGVIVDLNLVPQEGEPRPSELLLSHWPGAEAGWSYPRPASFVDDTAVAIYYVPRALEPGQTRRIGFGYGLGTISSTATRNAQLSLTVGGPIRGGAAFWLVALVNNPRPGQTVKLVLPPGLAPRRPGALVQRVQGSGVYTQLSWLVEVAPDVLGDVQVAAILEPGAITEKQSLRVGPADVQLSLVPRGPFRSGRAFWISALVHNPRFGQSVTLTLPDGLTPAKGHTLSKSPGSADSAGYAQMNWLVIPASRVDGRVELHAQLVPDGVLAHATVEIKPGDLTH